MIRINTRWAWTAIFAITLGLSGCSQSDNDTPPAMRISSESSPQESGHSGSAVTRQPSVASPFTDPIERPPYESHPIVEFQTNAGTIKVKLDAEKAPRTVRNFLENYVDRGFYEGTIFHYVESGFIVVGGGYTADGQLKRARLPIENEANNGLKNRRGTIAMSRFPDDPNSATSQFFFNLADNSELDYKNGDGAANAGYCVFGQVIEGLDVLDRIAQVEVHNSGNFVNMPVQPVIITGVRRVP